MAEEPKVNVACPGCGKQYRLATAHAGRKVRCKCGAEFRVPDQAAADPPPDTGEIELAEPRAAPPKPAPAAGPACPQCGKKVSPGAVLCTNCGFNLKTKTRVASKVVLAAPAALSIGAAAAAAARMPRTEVEQEEEAAMARQARITDLYAPLVLLALGVGAMAFNFGYLRADTAAEGIGLVIIRVLMQLIISVPFLIAGMLILVRLLGSSFGYLGTALLKVAAISYFTGGTGGLLDFLSAKYTSGMAGMMVTPTINFLIFWGLGAWLFELEWLETVILWLATTLLPFYALMFIMPLVMQLLR